MIAWDDSIRVGIPTVDRDHKNILDHINTFIETVEGRPNTARVHEAFRQMERCIYRHLEVEEGMLAAVGYTHAGDHGAEHERLTEELDAIWDGMLADPDFKPDDAARSWLESWLFKHVKSEDFAYRDWIVSAGREEDAERAMKEQHEG